MLRACLHHLEANNSNLNNFLIGDDYTFFKTKVHKKHTNFSIYDTEIEGSTHTVITRNADLLSSISIVWNVKESFFPGTPRGICFEKFLLIYGLIYDYCDHVKSVYDLFDEIVLEIGNSVINKIDSKSCRFLNESKSKFCDDPRTYGVQGVVDMHKHFVLRVPFWFSKQDGNDLPLIALQYHTVSLKTKSSKNYIPTKIRLQYITLDWKERHLFNSSSLEYAYNFIQYNRLNETFINLRAPTRYVFFELEDMTESKVSLYINGLLKCSYDRYQLTIDNYKRSKLRQVKGFGLISFCLDGNTTKPSGSINFSGIEEVKIFGLKHGAVIRSDAWNVLRIQGGMGAAVYSHTY